MQLLTTYLPEDRVRALARGEPLAEHATGAALFADISGFTSLTEELARALGPQLGAEALTDLLNSIYDGITSALHRFRGSSISFNGDAVTCWFDNSPAPLSRGVQPAVLRAAACARAMHASLAPAAEGAARAGLERTLNIKVSIAAGASHRLVVGDPSIQRIDTVAGTTMEQLAAAERLARPGETVLAPAAAEALGPAAVLGEWRADQAGARCVVLAGLRAEVPDDPWPPLGAVVSPAQLRPWLLPPVYERIVGGGGEFLAELRPAAIIFLRFAGLDFDDPAAAAQLDAYIWAVQRILAQFGGYLLQLTIGDKGCYVYAAFGPLAAHEDDANRAVLAALALRDLARPGVRDVQIGVSAGRVRAGGYGGRGRRTYGVLGDAVNLAARLMLLAAPGQVLVSPEVRQAAGAIYVWRALPPVQIKGRVVPLAPFSLEGRQPPGSAGVPPAHTLPLAGRDPELALLHELVAAAAEGAARVLLIEGEPGMGKSRLLAEAARLAAARGLRPLQGAATSLDREAPLFAWRSVLSAALGLEVAGAAELRGRVEAWAAGAEPAVAERLPLLNPLLPFELPETPLLQPLSPLERHALRVELLIVLLREAAGGPLVLLLDDSQWLDSLSWGVALALARASRAHGAPLLLVVAGQRLDPEAAPPERAELLALPGAAHLSLAPLDAERALALAAAALEVQVDELPDELAALLRERAEGSPFLAEQLALALRDAGLVTVDGGPGGRRVQAAPEADLRGALPATVEGVVLARIDRLGLEEQLTLKVGAVIGREFEHRPLQAAFAASLSGQAAALDGWLRSLVRRELIAAGQGAGRYLFRQGVTREVAYATLLYAQRRALHRLVAEWYERTYDEAELVPHYALLAGHWDAADDAPRALRYLELAGERALEVGAAREARALFARALERLPAADVGGRREAALREHLGAALWYAGALEPAAVQLEASVGLARQARDEATLLVALGTCGRVQIELGDYPRARAALSELAGLAERAGSGDRLLAALRNLGWLELQEGGLDEARRVLGRALALADDAGSEQSRALILLNLGLAATLADEFAEAEAHFAAALAIVEARGDRWNQAVLISNLGELAARRGDPRLAEELALRSLAIDRAIGNRGGAALTLLNLADLACERGDAPVAARHLREALPLCAAGGSAYYQLCALYVAARLHVLRGDPGRAGPLLALVLDHPAAGSDLRAQARGFAGALTLPPPAGPTLAEALAGALSDLRAMR